MTCEEVELCVVVCEIPPFDMIDIESLDEASLFRCGLA